MNILYSIKMPKPRYQIVLNMIKKNHKKHSGKTCEYIYRLINGTF
jgi:hypothetical protein